MISSIFYNGDGSTRIFPVTFKINGEDYVRVYVDNVEVIDRTKYDIINNSIVFTSDDIPAVGTDNIKIYVATSASELGDLGAPLTDITNVANSLSEIVAVSTQVIPNLPEILLADNNATIATSQATIATTKASEAAASATSASNSATSASGSASTATTKASEALASQVAAAASASTASTKASEANTSAGNAASSASTASTQAGIATTKATEASNSASTASTSASTATTKADSATASASAAASSATLASTMAAEADADATSAANSAISASNSATSASNSATTATTKANEASANASSALTSANNANTSETMAYKWSSNPVDTIVETDKYSALHWATKAQQWASTVDTTNFVDRTTNQTISGTKTFSNSPVVPNATTVGQVVNKGQLDTKQDTLVSGTNIKTINSNSLLGSGDIVVGETAWTANDSRAKTALNASGEAPIYACRAWVNFNGTGTVAIRASGNVSSITDNGTGNYTVNFTSAMVDANYSATADVARTYSTITTNAGALFGVVLNSSIRINTVTPSSGSVLDAEGVFIKIHR